MDLIIVVEISQPCDLLGGALLKHRLIQLSRLAGASDKESFPVFIKQALWNPRPPRVIGQMGFRDKLVQVVPADVIFRKNNNMMGRHLADGVHIPVSVAVHFL